MFTFSKFFLFACAGLAVAARASSVQSSPYMDAPVLRVTSDVTNHTDSYSHLELRGLEDPFDESNVELRDFKAHFEEQLRRSYIAEEQDLHQRWIAALVRGAAQLIMKVVNIVKGKIEHDKALRSEFTKHVVDEGRRQKSDMNWIACHPKHRTQWKGTRGKDWNHMHQEFDVSFHKTVGYEIYWAREGEFWNEGDGGYLNWAFAGKFTRDHKNIKHVIFEKI